MLDLLCFEEAYFDRIWGGEKLRGVLGKSVPPGRRIGEAWLIADHPVHESVVKAGGWQGWTLRGLMQEHAAALLGSAKPTPYGRFPLLLKLLDSADALSVQVHPDDAAAQAMGEPDVGKTEMWHVLHADSGSELICGLVPGVTPEAFAAAIASDSVSEMMMRFPAPPGTSVFVPAGTVHAIGGGLLLAEIQQNSDITYRIYDWARVDDQGNPRTLHAAKALEAIHFSSGHSGTTQPLRCEMHGVECSVLAACRYFAAVLRPISGACRLPVGNSFHIGLIKEGALRAKGASDAFALPPGDAFLAPACLDHVEIQGEGTILDYFVPSLRSDIIQPLLDAGHAPESIARLGGDAAHNDLLQFL